MKHLIWLIAIAGLMACCEPYEPEPVEVVREAEGVYELTGYMSIGDDFQENTLTGSFLVDVANGLRDGDYWHRGYNWFSIQYFPNPAYTQYWSNSEITVYGGDGNDDTVAIVGDSKAYPYITTSTSQTGIYKKEIDLGGGFYYYDKKAQEGFTETVNNGDNVIPAWVISVDSIPGTNPILTDTTAFLICQSVADNTGLPYLTKMRFIYKGDTDDTNDIAITEDSLWVASDTQDVKQIMYASDTNRVGGGGDTLSEVQLLDSYNRIHMIDTLDYMMGTNERIKQKMTVWLYKAGGGPSS